MYQLKAAEGDYAPAVNAMGDKHQYGQEGIEKDYDYAFSKFYQFPFITPTTPPPHHLLYP